MGRRILDEKIMDKLAEKLRKMPAAISVMVSKVAAKRGISPEAALIVLAKASNIGTATFQRKLDAAKQAEIRDALALVTPSRIRRPERSKKGNGNGNTQAIGKKAALRFAIDSLIEDPVLQDRCRDILMASSKFDRPINQATQVLEDRIRKKAQPDKRLTGEALVGFAFNEELSK